MSRLRIFLCHASDDKPLVRDLCRRLREDGFEPWLDEERLLPGQDWRLEVSAAVQNSDAVIVCLSSSSVSKAGYVQKELRHVLDVADYQPEGRIFVIPARLEECVVPTRLGQWQYVNLFAEDGYARLCAALRARAEGAESSVLSARPSGIGSPSKIAHSRWRSLAIAATLVLVIAAGAGVIAMFAFRNWFSGAQTEDTVPTGMVHVPGGRFLMGRSVAAGAVAGKIWSEASPAHDVTVNAFLLDQSPVTNARFREFLRSSNRPVSSQWPGGDLPAGQDNWPVTGITWDEAYAYCLAQGRRLPSEAEWEFAARGTDGRLYPWGDAFDPAAANSRESGPGHPEPVGTRAQNRSPYKIVDMSGNIWQWCADYYGPYPGGTAGFAIPPGAKVIRGGSFQSDRLHVAAVTRNLELPSTRSPAIGFRCAK